MTSSDDVFDPIGASEQEVAETIVSARKSWKTVKGKSEPVWPPDLEKALVKGKPSLLESTIVHLADAYWSDCCVVICLFSLFVAAMFAITASFHAPASPYSPSPVQA